MFFNIAQQADSRFPNNHKFESAYFNCDNGWNSVVTPAGTVFAKGYCDTHTLEQTVAQFDTANQLTGNFCLVRFGHTIEIKHNKYRSFPLEYGDSHVSNLVSGPNRVWADGEIEIDSAWKIQYKHVELDLSSTETLTIDQAKDKIKSILGSTIEQFYNLYNPQLKLFCSGGVDTLLIYSLLKQHQQSFELLPYLHYDLDYFTTKNQNLLEQFWSYGHQIHHWVEPSWLASGSHGDEYFLRGPATISMLTAWHDIDFWSIVESNPNSYHYYHFKKYQDLWINGWKNRHQLKEQYSTRAELNQQILNVLVNDHQYWHLGNTLTWTPFKNIDFVKILLQCDINELLPQFIDAQLTKDLITPDLLPVLSCYKNRNPMENLTKLLRKNNS